MALRAIFDASWKRRVQRGDKQAVAMLAEEAMSPLFRFSFYRVGRDRHLCEDVVQETLVQALRRIDQYQPERADGDVFGWLTGLARNEIRRALRSRGKAESLEALWGRMDRELLAVYAKLESAPFDDALLARAETREMVNVTMSQLPPRYGKALEAKYMLGQSVRQIAAALDVSEKAAESLLGRARKAFSAAFTTLARNLQDDSLVLSGSTERGSK